LTRAEITGAALVAASACGFATLGIFGTELYAQGFDLPSVLAWRFGGATVLFWIWIVARRRWRIPWRTALTAVAMGAVGYALQSTLYFVAIGRIGVGLTALLLYTYPAFVAMLAWLVYREQPSRRRIAALAITFVGTSLAANPHGPHADWLGLTAGVATGAWYAVYLTVGTRLVSAVDSLTASAYVCLGAMLSFVIASFAGAGLHMPAGAAAAATIAAIVVVATVIPITTLFGGMRRLGTPRAAVLSTLEPLVTVALGAAILHERLGRAEFAGGILIIGALIVLQMPEAPALARADALSVKNR